MITIFRRVRQKFIESGSLTKYLLYAVGEILLVVIGILIALQVNNWNEERKQEKISAITLESLKQELIDAELKIDEYITGTTRQNDLTEKFLDGELNVLADSINTGDIFELANYIPLRIELPVLLNEIGSDNTINDNNEFINKLRIVESRNQRLKQTHLYLDSIWTDQIVPFYIKKRFMYVASNYVRNESIDLQKTAEVFQDDEFRELVSVMFIGRTAFFDRTITMKEAISDILDDLDSES